MRILVIDDADTTSKIEAALESLGHQIVSAGSMAAASSSLEENQFDAIFFDYNHNPGGGTGLSGLEELQKLSRNAKVVVLTGNASIETAVESMRLGAADYIPKPFTPDHIRRVVSRLGQDPASIDPRSGIQVGTRVTLEELEHAHIRRILLQASSMEEAAQVLGIDPATLYRKRKRFSL
jgi:DNA-binding NtrC family response regulator